MSFNNKKIIITGARGYIGSALSEYFSKINCELILIDRTIKKIWKPSGKKAKLIFIKLDLSNLKKIKRYKVFDKTSYVFHLAGTDVDYSRDIYEDYIANCLITLNLLSLFKVNKIKPKIINASAAMIYGLTNKLPVNENNLDSPPSFWALHKLLAENYLKFYSKKYNFKTISLRLCNIYGPSSRIEVFNKMVLNKVMLMAHNKNEIYLFNNKNCIRDFVYIDDVIKAFILISKIPQKYFDGRSLVLGSGENLSLEKVWKKVSKLINNSKIKFINSHDLNIAEKRNFTSKSIKLKKITGWKATYKIDQGLKKTFNFIEINSNKLK